LFGSHHRIFGSVNGHRRFSLGIFDAVVRHIGCGSHRQSSEGGRMFASAAPYLMAVFGMSFAAASAVTLIYFIGHLDPPENPTSTSR